MIDKDPPLWRSVVRIALQIAIIVLVAYAVHLLMDWIMDKSDSLAAGDSSLMLTTLVLAILLAYAVLIAIPFVPGIEIGFTLILMQGASIVPFVYVSTVLGLFIAFLVGRYVSNVWLAQVLRDFRLQRASDLVVQVQGLSPAERVALLRDRLPDWFGKSVLRWRYVVIGLLINIPGNALIGGGGGIAMIAGLSRLFAPPAVFLTLILAVSPLPLLIWVFGIELLK